MISKYWCTWIDYFWSNPTPTVQVVSSKEMPVKDISEPVISFVECVKNNPKRFRLTESTSTYSILSVEFRLIDLLTKEEFKVRSNITAGSRWWSFDYDLNWLTQDEEGYLIEQLQSVFESKANKLKELKTIRLNVLFKQSTL
jgi:hypothetical protein